VCDDEQSLNLTRCAII